MKCDNCASDTNILFNVKYEDITNKDKPYRMDICFTCFAIIARTINIGWKKE